MSWFPEILKQLGTAITSTAAEINKLDGATVTKDELNVLDGGVHGVTFTIGAEDTNSINVALQLEDANGAAIAAIGVVHAYLSDSATGDGVVATAPDGDIAVGTDGTVLGELVADKVFLLQSEADGDIDLDIGEAGALTVYLCVIVPASGLLAVSGAITFAA